MGNNFAIDSIELSWKLSEKTLAEVDNYITKINDELTQLERFAKEASDPSSDLGKSFKKFGKSHLDLSLEKDINIEQYKNYLRQLEENIEEFEPPEIQQSGSIYPTTPISVKTAGKEATKRKGETLILQEKARTMLAKRRKAGNYTTKENAKKQAQKFCESCQECLEQIKEQYEALKSLNEDLKKQADLQRWGPWLKEKIFKPASVSVISTFATKILPGYLKLAPIVITIGYDYYTSKK